MMRILIGAIVALTLGVTAGSVFVRARLGPQLDDASQERDGLVDELGKAKTAFEEIDAYAVRLKLDNTNLMKELDALYVEMNSKNQTVPVTAATIDDEDSVETESPPEENNRRRRQGRREFTEEERAQMEERRTARREAFQQRRGRIQDYWDNEYQRATDPEVRERILALLEYESYIGELRGEWRELESEEDRFALTEEIREAGSIRTDLLREQQDYLLREIAEQSGISDAQAQADLVDAFRETLQSPTFQNQGGRFGERRGPGGGFGRRGGGPRNQP